METPAPQITDRPYEPPMAEDLELVGGIAETAVGVVHPISPPPS